MGCRKISLLVPIVIGKRLPLKVADRDHFVNEESGVDYRFGFNGKEKDTDGEWGTQTHYDYGMRIYNPAIGRWMSIDPLAAKYPELSPFVYAINSPVSVIDPDGGDIIVVGTPEYRAYVKEQLTLLRMTDAGMKIFNALENRATQVVIRANRGYGYEKSSLSQFNMSSNVLTFSMPKDLKISKKILATLGHEDIPGLKKDAHSSENSRATAFENYLRDMFGEQFATRYGYKTKKQKEYWDKRINAILSPNDRGSQISVHKKNMKVVGPSFISILDLSNKANPIQFIETDVKHVSTDYLKSDGDGAKTKTIKASDE